MMADRAVNSIHAALDALEKSRSVSKPPRAAAAPHQSSAAAGAPQGHSAADEQRFLEMIAGAGISILSAHLRVKSTSPTLFDL